MRITNRMGLPEALVKAVSVKRHNKPGQLSATTLLNGTKQILLTDRHWESLEEDVADRFWAILGTAVHGLLEHAGENELVEEFVSHDVDGVTVTGRIDNYNTKTGVVTDYKTVSATRILRQDFGDWWKQGMIYAWLLRGIDLPVSKCRFISMIKDHKKRDAARNPSYPQTPMHVYEFDVTERGLAEIGAFVADKVARYKLHREMADDDIPPCSPEERWERPSEFAVMKAGLKRAVRKFDSRQEADAFAGGKGSGHFVETRPGESVRCQDWCACSGFCNFRCGNIRGEVSA